MLLPIRRKPYTPRCGGEDVRLAPGSRLGRAVQVGMGLRTYPDALLAVKGCFDDSRAGHITCERHAWMEDG